MDQRGDTRLTASEMTSLRALGWRQLDQESNDPPPFPREDIMPLDPKLVENGTAVDLPVV